MDSVETMALPKEVGRSLRRAPNATHLCNLLRVNAVLPSCLDDVVRDLVMPTSGAQGRLATGVLGLFQVDYVKLQHYDTPSRTSRIISEYTLALGGIPSL